MARAPWRRRRRRRSGPDPTADVDDELRFHLESRVDDLVAQGWDPDTARREARRRFGDLGAVQQAGERLADERSLRMLKEANSFIGGISNKERRAQLEAAAQQGAVPLVEATNAGHAFVFDGLQERLTVARQRIAELFERLANPNER